jgi:hypothetical protein
VRTFSSHLVPFLFGRCMRHFVRFALDVATSARVDIAMSPIYLLAFPRNYDQLLHRILVPVVTNVTSFAPD